MFIWCLIGFKISLSMSKYGTIKLGWVEIWCKISVSCSRKCCCWQTTDSQSYRCNKEVRFRSISQLQCKISQCWWTAISQCWCSLKPNANYSGSLNSRTRVYLMHWFCLIRVLTQPQTIWIEQFRMRHLLGEFSRLDGQCLTPIREYL